MSEKKNADAGTPAVITIPPLIYLAFLALGGVLEYLFPTDTLPDTLQYVLGGAIIVLSASVMPFVLTHFRRAGTPFNTRKAAAALVISGPFRFSRNPGYLSLTLLHAGIGVLVDSIWIVALLVPTVAIVQYGLIAPEERYLEERFGEAYLQYKKTVRRWF